ncbi:MAG: OmpH family outer membrane protein [Prevotella sp.]|nr:OmpH family outer membrane protein [Prevotella sp.]
MNKKNKFQTVAFAAFAMLAITSCNNQPQVETANAEGEQAANVDTKIAFVEVDSIMTQYDFCKDYSLILQKKGQNIQNTLTKKQNDLEAAAAKLQQRIQRNDITQSEYEQIQASLQKQSNDLQALNQRLSNEFQNLTETYNTALRDSIQHFLAKFNADKRYTLILSKVGDNLLYADEALDITADVVAGLNKAYKPTKELKAEEKVKK